ncbi:MAG TPA: hypothetical protein VGX28_11950 [Frankiaceae bacterium]|jgi:hypothetical protein|nr:hypothetical protein [Frankiaceae bacterium]
MRARLLAAALVAAALTPLAPAGADGPACALPCLDAIEGIDCMPSFQLVCKVRDLIVP